MKKVEKSIDNIRPHIKKGVKIGRLKSSQRAVIIFDEKGGKTH